MTAEGKSPHASSSILAALECFSLVWLIDTGNNRERKKTVGKSVSCWLLVEKLKTKTENQVQNPLVPAARDIFLCHVMSHQK